MPRSTFLRIDAEKQHKILATAARQFAIFGFHKANINTIADKAGISIGAMYKYFENKEDLFCTTLDHGVELISANYEKVQSEPLDDPFERIRRVMENSMATAHRYPDYISLYLVLLTSAMDEMADPYARTIEQVGSESLKQILQDGIDSGHLDPDLDVEAAALVLDNHLVMFTFTVVSRFLQLRQETFAPGITDAEQLIDSTVELCRRMFSKTPRNVEG